MMRRHVIEELTDWSTMRARFRWDIPHQFNIAKTCCDDWADSAPDKIAIRHISHDGTERAVSYARLAADSDALAAGLARLGVGFGDRVAILLPQCPEVMVAHFASYKLGAIALPLFVLFGPDALAYRLADSGAKTLITDAENAAKIARIRADLPALETIITLEETPGALAWSTLTATPTDGFHPARTSAEDPACLIYTSGTTGTPKGVVHAHRFLIGHLPAIECHHEGFGLPGDTGWTPADWAWIGGLMDLAMPCLYYGVPLISHRMRKFDPDQAWNLIARTGATNLFLPPTALKMMAGSTVPAGVNIRAIGSGGESLGPALLGWGKQELNAHINELYGQTECNLVVSSCAAVGAERPGAMGRAVPGTTLAVIDAHGHELPPGRIGEIAVARGHPAMFLRYWNKPAETEKKFQGNWMRTGDLGHMDAQGFVSFHARDDDVITTSGYRVGPAEIEHCLCADPDIALAAVIGVPDATRTESIKAFVVLKPGAAWPGTEARLIARIRRNLSPHMAPRSIERRDHLPMTATGKIMRRALRDETPK